MKNWIDAQIGGVGMERQFGVDRDAAEAFAKKHTDTTGVNSFVVKRVGGRRPDFWVLDAAALEEWQHTFAGRYVVQVRHLGWNEYGR